jgi:amino acid transporter
VLLLILGVLLGWAAAPAWTELVLMWPNRVGGISAACAVPITPSSRCSPALATGGAGFRLAASPPFFPRRHWYFPDLPVEAFAIAIVCFFTFVNLGGIKWVARLAMPIATASATLAFLSALIPIYSGTVDWHQAFSYQLTAPFEGWFGDLTSIMAGLFLIGFTAPAFEAAACHVGETVDPNKNVPGR